VSFHLLCLIFLLLRPPPCSPLFPYTTLFRSFYFFWWAHLLILLAFAVYVPQSKHAHLIFAPLNVWFKKLDPPGKLTSLDFEDESDRKSTRLNSSYVKISYAVFCLKKKIYRAT